MTYCSPLLGNLTSLASCSADPTRQGCPRSSMVVKESMPRRPPLTWLALVVLTWLTAQAAYRVAQLFRPGRRGWQLALLAVELALMLLLMQLAPPVLIAFVWVLADSQKLTNLFTNLHRLRPPFRLFPASHSEYLWDPVVCKLFTQVALSREFTGP